MFTKEHLQKILRVNGLSSESSDEEIKKIIAYAKGQDVNEAIALLREEQVTDVSNKDKKPDFQTNLLAVEGRLKPASIKRLLGIDLEVNYADLEEARESRKRISFTQILSIALCSLFVALVGWFIIMKYYQINLLMAFFNTPL